MQDAFASESGTFAGDWNTIGYAMPASSNFTYTEPAAASFSNASDASSLVKTTDFTKSGATAVVGWQGSNKANLNDCNMNSTWQLKFEQDTGVKGTLKYTPVVSDKKCELLTPNFIKLGGN